uniref:Pre-mRNA-processing factor 17 n=2 Tax=Macrostomum lignano TaxID=282301 RepID=A0A1I8GUG9_9PLAT
MAAASLVSYEASSDEGEPDSAPQAQPLQQQPSQPSLSTRPVTHSSLVPKLDLTPDVSGIEQATRDSRPALDPTCKELAYNPKADELFAPVLGPQVPGKSTAPKNTLTGFVEPSHMNDFHFETQRRTFHSYGYAADPSIDADSMVGNTARGAASGAVTVFEGVKKRPGDNRKRRTNNDPADIEGYLGPWGKFVDEALVAAPPEEDREYMQEYLAKKAKNKRRPEETPVEEKTTMHVPAMADYQGRSLLEPPRDAGVNFRSDEGPRKCFLPKRQLHEWVKAHDRGVAAIRLFPRTGHLLLSAGMDSKLKLFELYKERRLLRTYSGHRQAVRDACFSHDGSQFLSASYDRYVKLWDTETGKCVDRWDLGHVPYCVKFNPDPDKANFFLAGCNNKKIICMDTRTGEVTQEYDRHLGSVNTITFIDDNKRFVSTSDDKSLRMWEWDIPVDYNNVSDPSMHSMPAVTLSPNGKWLVCQSLDNQIVVFNVHKGMKQMKKKCFKGHMAAGYACSIDFSPDMKFLMSGDGDGKLFIWDWKKQRIVTRWKAHDGPCVSSAWLPYETSKVVTSGWDGTIRLWD